ncbi:MAG: glycosyltransferase family 2 protein [Cytophagia bacterium]|nr:glycosyltransferase family 2 protein [Cytophagia bacterium]
MISVIIPVYNAEKFIYKAVRSVLCHSCVGEVLLIEDGSEDNSIIYCRKIASESRNVKLYIHPNNENRGASASRNLGIINSSFPYIAFLDADDYFLPNRFETFIKFVNEGILFDGIYEAIQYFNGSNKIYGIKKNIPPNKLTHFLIRGTYGHFHTNGLIIKKEILLKAGLFVESLDLHQDSDLWIKISHYGNLVSGDIGRPVAMVRRHEGNRIWKGTNFRSMYKQIQVTWNWAKREDIGLINKTLLFRKLIKYRVSLLFRNE